MNELIEKWVEIGMGNKWISQAWDPAFDENCYPSISQPISR